MSNIIIKFPDSSSKEYPSGITCYDIVKSISNSLAKKVLAASFNNDIIDISTPLSEDGEIKFLTWDDEEGKSTFWHSSAHILAEAVESLYPGVKFGIGPSIANGFYYDIDFIDYDVSKLNTRKIEKKFIELSSSNLTFERSEISKADALNYFKKKNDPYKLELINDLDDGDITFYKQGNFTDLCKGPHIPSSKFIKSFKILRSSLIKSYFSGTLRPIFFSQNKITL